MVAAGYGLPPQTGRSPDYDILPWLSAMARIDFLDVVRPLALKPGERLYGQGERGQAMYRVAEGAIRLSIAAADGRQLVLRHFRPGDCFGISGLIDGKAMPHNAEAVGATRLQTLARSGFDRLRGRHRSFEQALLVLMCRQTHNFAARIADVTMHAVGSRLARQLCDLARRDHDGVLVVEMAQTELALMLGAARQTVNKVLRGFEKERLVELSYARIVIVAPGGLRRLASMPGGPGVP